MIGVTSMEKVCKNCGKLFQTCNKRQVYCCITCKSQYTSRNRDYKKYYENNKEKRSKYFENYKESVKEKEGITDTDFYKQFREHTAANKGMTVAEYNRYLESEKARKLGLSVEDLRHYTYLAKKYKRKLFEVLNIPENEYKKRLKGA